MKKIPLSYSQLIGGIVVSLMCFCAVCTSRAQVPGRDTTATFYRDSMMMREAIDSIEKWTDYVFQNKGVINPQWTVFVGHKQIPVRKLLELWSKEHPVEFSMQGKYIGSRARTTEVDKSDIITMLHGVVTDKNGYPIYKASVGLNNTKSGTTTDADGNFWLYNVRIGSAISVSCVGRITHNILLLRDTILYISLEERTNPVKTYEVTGSKPKQGRTDTSHHLPPLADITMTTQVNMLDGLSGEIPGVILQRPTGRTAGSRTTEIRGPTSFDRNSQVLYVIDGVMINPEFKGGEGTMSQYSSTLSYFPTADIERIVALKSAIATALYGARGANGVVLIFTKRAAHTKGAHIMADVSYGFGWVPRREPMLTTGQYLQMRWDAWINDGLPPTNGKAPDMLSWDPLRYTDWQKVLIGNIAQYRDATVTISGERPAVQYRISGTYGQNTTVYMQEGNKYGDHKYSLHASANIKLWDSSLLISATGLASVNGTRLPGMDHTAGIGLPPNGPSLFINGQINYAVKNSIVSMPEFAGSVSNILTTANIRYLINKRLDFTLIAGYHRMGANNTSIMNIARRGEEGQGNLTASSTEDNFLSQTLVIEPSLQLKLDYNLHKATVQVGSVYNSMHTSNTTIDAAGYLRDRDILNYGLAKTVVRTPFTNRYKYAGVYTHVNYAWKEKYTLELIFRADGSSRFGKDERVNKYGGGAIGWDFGRETFIQHALPSLSYGKVQLGWSATGNDQIADYQYAGSYQPAGSYQSVEGLVAAKQQNRALTGGMTYKKDITFNMGFFNNKWEIEAAYYSNSSRHQLVEYPLPDMAGGGTMQQNMPVAIQNSGIELTLNAKLVQRTHCSLAIRFNAAKGMNMLLSFPGLMPAPAGQTQLKRPLRELFYYDFAGVNPKNGEYVYRNRAGDMVSADALTENDRTVAVNISPRFYGGFGFTCTIYNFELSCSGQYMKRMAENAIIDKQHIPGTMWNQNVYVAGRWRRIGDNAQVQRATQASSAEADFKKYLNSTAIFMNVWYIRVNNITVAWKNGEQGKYRIYCNISNPLTFTNYRSLDPETLSRTVLPFLRTIKIGAQYLF